VVGIAAVAKTKHQRRADEFRQRILISVHDGIHAVPCSNSNLSNVSYFYSKTKYNLLYYQYWTCFAIKLTLSLC
jgi:hypothetical protein